MISDRTGRDWISKAIAWYDNFDEGVSGKPAAWVNEDNRNLLSASVILLSLLLGVYSYLAEMDRMYLAVSEWRNVIHCLIVALVAVFAWSTTLSIVLKGTFTRSIGAPFLGFAVAWTTYSIISGVSYFMIISAEWEIIWANRATLFLGIELNTGVVNPDFENETWRLWPTLILSTLIVCSAIGTTKEETKAFAIKLFLLWLACMFYVWYPTKLNYNPDGVMIRLTATTLLGLAAFAASRRFRDRFEEFQVNKLRSYLALAGVATFFISISLLNPPDAFVENGIAEKGIEPFLWGGLFVNVILLVATLVLGSAASVLLAFGRRSELPFFSWPATLIIEFIRSGPMVAWLFIALFILPDVIRPFYEADVVIRTILTFSIFGACYIAEVLRGGLQNVPRGQIEAATALGLSPTQIKLFVELPSAVRTTLPAIVSIFIGLWKDTTLVYLLGVLDLYAIAKVLPATDLHFGDDYLEPLIFAAAFFWFVALVLSRISLKVEESLGLLNEGGGEAT